MDVLSITAAYKYVAICAMLTEINYFANKLDLPLKRPVLLSNVESVFVGDPHIMEFGGSIDTEGYSFGFHKGYLSSIMRKSMERDLSIMERHLKWASMSSMIGTNEAYQLATNWLAAVDVDVAELEKKHVPWVWHHYFYSNDRSLVDPPDPNRPVTLLPLFDVNWGTNYFVHGSSIPLPIITVSIFGPKKELIALYQNESTFTIRPKGLIKNVNKLMAIPNEAFKQYSPAERSNLVEKCLLFNYKERSTNAATSTNVQATESRTR